MAVTNEWKSREMELKVQYSDSSEETIIKKNFSLKGLKHGDVEEDIYAFGNAYDQLTAGIVTNRGYTDLFELVDAA